jgi:hypothetical protein
MCTRRTDFPARPKHHRVRRQDRHRATENYSCVPLLPLEAATEGEFLIQNHNSRTTGHCPSTQRAD